MTSGIKEKISGPIRRSVTEMDRPMKLVESKLVEPQKLKM